VNITINVDGLTIDSVVGSHYDDESERTVPTTLGQAVVEEIVRTLRERTRAADLIAQAVKEGGGR